MLVDSGSSASFVSHQLLPHLRGVQEMPRAVKVSVANGAELQCTKEVSDCPWFTQGHAFSSNFKVLPLGSIHFFCITFTMVTTGAGGLVVPSASEH